MILNYTELHKRKLLLGIKQSNVICNMVIDRHMLLVIHNCNVLGS